MMGRDQYTCLMIGAGKTRLQASLGRSVTEALGRGVGIISRIDRAVEAVPGILIRVDLVHEVVSELLHVA
jgi:hypothetical protein